MNSIERMKKRLQGEVVDRPPNFDIFMTFAAHHIGKPLHDYYQDHRVLVEANLAILNDFDVDIVQAISDPYREAADFGLDVEFPKNSLPINHTPLIAAPEDLLRLQPPEPASGCRMSDRLEAIRFFREQVGGEVPIMGWVEGPFAEAVDLRGMTNLMMDLIERPEWVEELLEICGQVAVKFALAQMEAGADMIGLGDAAASQISPAMYRRFALPYEQKIFEAVHAAGGLTRLHICGDTNKIVPDMVKSNADIIDLDWMVDMGQAGDQFSDQVSFNGNFDPVAVMLQGTSNDVYQATIKSLRQGGVNSFSTAGCEIPDRTPVENLHAQSRALQEYSE
ncbi:MAG: uroporphyrinogen decarboxylase family protein [Anaerolineaceae bacterium]|nr:uroporphyrinogen decarboxylase family protein [Anaerolineaceae bacterium]